LNRFNVFVSKNIRKLGAPGGGGVEPSRSEGNNPPTESACWKQTWVAEAPVSILERSNAQARAPRNVVPKNMLKVT